MRVIAGISRGTKLVSPEGLSTRPTLDRIKEAIFNSIAFNVPETEFLDLFSGTGAIGIEALSRGAKKAVFVENSDQNVEIINKNLEKTKLKNKSKIYKSDVFYALPNIAKEHTKFDIIFMDPPYKDQLINETLKNVCNLKILKKDGIIICEQSSKDDEPKVDGLEILKIKKYKTTKIIFLKLM